MSFARNGATLETLPTMYIIIGTYPQKRRVEKFHIPVSKWLKAAEDMNPARRRADVTVQESIVRLKGLNWLSGEVQLGGRMRRPAEWWTDWLTESVQESMFGRRLKVSKLQDRSYSYYYSDTAKTGPDSRKQGSYFQPMWQEIGAIDSTCSAGEAAERKEEEEGGRLAVLGLEGGAWRAVSLVQIDFPSLITGFKHIPQKYTYINFQFTATLAGKS